MHHRQESKGGGDRFVDDVSSFFFFPRACRDEHEGCTILRTERCDRLHGSLKPVGKCLDVVMDGEDGSDEVSPLSRGRSRAEFVQRMEKSMLKVTFGKSPNPSHAE
jgi:hypothetical protein